ncbi:MAG: NAD-glutamate dehydrogenase domain-containing protein [Actinomycetota bacterium]
MSDGLDRLYERFRNALSDERADHAVELANAAYRRLPAAERAALDLDQAESLILDALTAFEAGDGSSPQIRVEAVGPTTIVHVHAVDGPFVVSTVTEELHRLGLSPIDLLHPVVGVARDGDGNLKSLGPARTAPRRETYLAMDLHSVLNEESRNTIAEHLRDVLDDALHAMRDFLPIKQRIAGIAMEVEVTAGARYDTAEVTEVATFLRWLLDDYFVFLGYRGYDIHGTGDDATAVVAPGSGLGILHAEDRSRYAQPVPLSALTEALQHQATDGPLLRISRTNRLSSVHRQVRMIDVSIQKVDPSGRLVGEHRILGLLAQKAFVEPASTIPVLRRKLRLVLEAEDVVDHSHDERALRTLFDAFPKQELFESDVDELRQTMVKLLEVSRRQEVRLLVRQEPVRRSVSALVTVPRDRFSAELRSQVQELLQERSGATTVDYQLSMTERDQPLLHFTLHLPEDVSSPLDVDAVEQEIQRMTRTFSDALTEALAGRRGMVDAKVAAEQWCRVLPVAYTESTAVATAVTDIEELEALDGPDAVRMRLIRPPSPNGPSSRERLLRFRLYKAGEGVELSGFLPLLESLGLIVVEEQPYRMDTSPVWGALHMHDYGVRTEGLPIDVRSDGPRLADAAVAMWEGRATVDSLNRLVLGADMSIEQVTLLRAYRRYLRQIGTTYTEATTNEALIEYPAVARALIAYFDARFDPSAEGEEARLVAADSARREVLTALEAVERLDQDRILRSFLGVVDATLRTNRWRRRPWLSLKIDSSRVPGVPKPVPYREIFVYSTGMEGVHLRGGPVARGGLRWSDRLDDFRTEVLGLMKAQVTKNAVIVPTGSKGGFVLKHRPVDGGDLRAEVEAQYRVFIRGLLDVTDNIVDGEVVPPEHVVRADGDDPYLVVAADRGTATFSDIANGISAEYGFWLDDAFASGGSQGYDHKAMGITARGAWVAVQRHFRELSIDVQTDPITVVGVGDMSGDVFGNGMLRSRAIRLVAAFDHRDIFIDPTPDEETSFEERRRLFELPRSSWQDYDQSLVSAGGGIFSRTAKSVTLSPEAREALRIDAAELSPPELINAILKAPVDLLWFGGIGTYVKSREESNSEVGDRANDAVRVNADQVGARVVGEGGNLAMTQLGRIGYARRGGRCNTDATDNAAGVNTSDREVNLKILLSLAINAGQLEEDNRNDLLARLTEDVGDQVLRDQYLQTWAISQELSSAPGGMGAYEQMMQSLESRGRLDRAVELLPDTAEVEERRKQGAGFTRPELAVLLAYAKIDVTEQLLSDGVVDQPAFEPVRADYFPGEAATRFAALAQEHRLRRDLVATIIAGDLCNRMGITWATRTSADLGVDVSTVAAAYWIARQVIDADGLWREVEAQDARIDPTLQLELKAQVDHLVDAFTRSFVRQGRTGDIAGAIAQDRPAFVELFDLVGTTRVGEQHLAIQRTATRWVDLGIEDDLADRLARLSALTVVPGVAATARQTDRGLTDIGVVYQLVAERLPLEQMTRSLKAYEPHGRWERWQHRGLVDDVRRLHHAAAREALALADLEAEPAAVVDEFLSSRAGTVERAVGLARQVQGQAEVDLDALAVAVRALSEIAG